MRRLCLPTSNITVRKERNNDTCAYLSDGRFWASGMAAAIGGWGAAAELIGVTEAEGEIVLEVTADELVVASDDTAERGGRAGCCCCCCCDWFCGVCGVWATTGGL